MNTKEISKNRRFCAIGNHVWAVGDTIDDLKSNLGYEDFGNCIVHIITPPCPAWVDGMGAIVTQKPVGNKNFSKVFPVLDLRNRATKKRATSTKKLYENYLSDTDTGSSEVLSG